MVTIFNNSTDAVQQSIDSLVRIYPHLAQLSGIPALYDKHFNGECVPIISGGGSGHEPAHFGYIGKGMLTAAISGPIFIPPRAADILELIRFLNRGKGVFVIVKNFEADIASFTQAIQQAKSEGIDVRYIISHDDVSIDKKGFTPRHRGVAGTILLHKVLGYLSENGASIQEIEQTALSLSTKIATLGVATSSAILPNSQQPMFSLEEGKISFGIGIHGEPGYRTENFRSSELLANELINKLKIHFKWQAGDTYCLLVNNLGASSKLEELIFTNDLLQLLELEGLEISFIKTGHFMTSLNMGGLSVTLCTLKEPDWLNALKAPTAAPAW